MLLHGSRTRFDSFRIPTHEDDLTGASNGMLGTWFCRESHAFVAEGYGREGWIAEVEEPQAGEIIEVDLRQLRDWHENAPDDARQFYANIRNSFLKLGKTWIAVRECDGSNPTLVCLAPERLEIANWRSAIPETVDPGF